MLMSFKGIGGEFADVEFCDTSVIDPNSGEHRRHYPWWVPFSTGARFSVPRVAALNGNEINFNIEELVAEANTLFEAHGTLYPNAQNFGRKSLDKIVKRKPMSFPKAVMATRAVNYVLAHENVRDGNGNLVQIGKHEIMMSGYRLEGVSTALGSYAQQTRGGTENEGGSDFLARESGVSASIIGDLTRDDGQFISFPTAHALIQALLRNRHLFGISPEATELTFLRLGPPPGAVLNPKEIKYSLIETDDPEFSYRSARCPHPDNPFKWAA